MSNPITLRPDETFVINLGPQHPATHGVLRVKLTMDGEYIYDAETVIGYIHRMHEKMQCWSNWLRQNGTMRYIDCKVSQHTSHMDGLLCVIHEKNNYKSVVVYVPNDPKQIANVANMVHRQFNGTFITAYNEQIANKYQTTKGYDGWCKLL